MLGQLGPLDNRCKLGLSYLQENKEASFFFAPLGMVFVILLPGILVCLSFLKVWFPRFEFT